MDYWLSTKSPRRMFCASYCTPKLDKFLAESMGVDPAILVAATGLSVPSIKAYQRSLGLRKFANHMDYHRAVGAIEKQQGRTT